MVQLARGAGALGHRGFLIYTTGNGLSSLGLWVQRLAIGWLSWDLSRSELWVGLIAFALFAPVLLLSAPFGVLIDRVDARRAALAINVLMALWALLLGILTATGLLSVALLFLVALLIGVTTAAYAPARLSVIPSLVPRELLPSAIGVNSLIFNVSRLLGPALGGFVLVTAGAGTAFVLNAVSYVPLVAALLMIEMRDVARSQAGEGFLSQLIAGIAHARDNAVIRWQMLMLGWAALFGRSMLEVLPIYADRIYGKGALALGQLSAAAGAGALVAAFTISRVVLSNRQLEVSTMLLNLLVGVALMLLTLSDGLAYGLVQTGLVGFGATGSMIMSQTLVQLEVPDAFRGRVSSLWGMAGIGGLAFGSLLLGAMLDRLDIHLATALLGALCVALPLVALFRRGRAGR